MAQRIKLKVDEGKNPSSEWTYAYAGKKRTTPDTQCTGGVYGLTEWEADILRNGGTIVGFNGVEFYADLTPEPTPEPTPTPRKKFLGIF